MRINKEILSQNETIKKIEKLNLTKYQKDKVLEVFSEYLEKEVSGR